MEVTMPTQLQRQITSDEIAAGLQPDRTTEPFAIFAGFPDPVMGTLAFRWKTRCAHRPQVADWLANTERSARTMLGGQGMVILPNCLGSCDIVSSPIPEWFTSITSLGLNQAPAAPPRPVALAATKEQALHQRLLTASVGDQAREALAALAITKSQMAEILGIERPHLYAWLADKVGRASKGDRLRDLLKLLLSAGISSANPLRSHLATEPLEPDGEPLLTLLKGRDLGLASIAAALATAARLNRAITEEAARRQAKLLAAGHRQMTDADAQASFDQTMTEWDNA